MLASDFRPIRPIEFHWYSAEVSPRVLIDGIHSKTVTRRLMRIQEGGLLGSQAVASDYERRSVNVLAMSQVRESSQLRDVLSLNAGYI